MNQDKFYCDNCGIVNDFLIDEREAYYCPNCDYPIFESQADLDRWLEMQEYEPNFIEPFERSQKMER